MNESHFHIQISAESIFKGKQTGKQMLLLLLLFFFFKQNGTADAASMFPDEIYTAGVCFGLDVAAGESHNGIG